MSAILIAGCGYVGSATAARLRAEGHEVFCLRRQSPGSPADVHSIAADLRDPSSLVGLPSVSHLVYCASADERSEEAYQAAYVDGLSNLLAALRSAPLERVLFTSSTAVYPQSNGSFVDETSTTAPTQFSGRILLEAERLLLKQRFETIALRLAGIYGPGRTRLVKLVHEGLARPSPGIYGNRIHRDDCAGAIVHLLFHPSPEVTYLGVDDDPAPIDDVYAFVASLLGASFPTEIPGSTDASTVERSRGSKRCSNARLRASGYEPAYPSYRDGYPEIVREYLNA